MSLLSLEFTDAPNGSYNHFVGEFVKTIRHYRENVSVDEFRVALPSLQATEKIIQRMDAEMGEGKRNYIQEIMDELEKESEIQSQLIDEITNSLKVILKHYFKKELSIEDFDFQLKNIQSIWCLEFHGYSSVSNLDDKILNSAKEIFSSICSKSGIIFLDGENLK